MNTDAVQLVSALAAARKAVQLYPPSHPKHIEALTELEAAVRACCAAGETTINLYQGRLYAGSDVIAQDVPGAGSMAEALEARRVESLSFGAGFEGRDASGLVETLALRPSPELDVKAELEKRGVANVAIAFLVDEEGEEREERDRVREQNRALYRQVVAALRVIRERLSQGEQIALDQAGDMAQAVAARVLDNKASALGLATLTSQGESGLFHAVNVMIYSLTLGASLGLTEERLMSLGVGALLHDIGKAGFDLGDAESIEAMRLRHPERGAELLSGLLDEDSSPMLVAYEHHMAMDGSGFPSPPAGYEPHAYSRIVAIADRYENLTKGNGDPGQAHLTPDRAVARLLAEAGTALDPVLTRVFVQAMGVFPVGCLVRLSDQSVGVVYDEGEDPLTPKLRVLYGPDGSELATPQEVDLSADDRSIVEVVDPKLLRLEVAENL